MTDPQDEVPPRANDNALARLHTVAGRIQVADSSVAVRDFVAEIADEVAGGYNRSRSSRWTAELFDLIDEALEQIQQVPEYDSELMAQWYMPMVQAADVLQGFPWEPMTRVQQSIDDGVIFQLARDARDVHLHRPVSYLPAATVPGLLEIVREAIREIEASADLPPQLRLYMLGRLRDVEIALQHVQVVGLQGVEAAVDALIGAVMVRDQEQRSNGKLWGIARRIYDAVTFGSRGVQALEQGVQSTGNLFQMLPPGGGGS